MKKKRTGKPAAGIMAATTAKDWGFGPVPCKGGKTTDSAIGEGMIHRELKEMRK